jgi:hypothetical protein
MQVLWYFAPPCVGSAEYVHLLSKRITAQSQCSDKRMFMWWPECRSKSWYINTETSEVKTIHQIQEMLGIISSQSFAYNQKNVTTEVNFVLTWICLTRGYYISRSRTAHLTNYVMPFTSHGRCYARA